MDHQAWQLADLDVSEGHCGDFFDSASEEVAKISLDSSLLELVICIRKFLFSFEMEKKRTSMKWNKDSGDEHPENQMEAKNGKEQELCHSLLESFY